LFGIDEPADLSDLLLLPGDLGSGTYKCRVVYSDIVHSIEFLTYIPRQINSLKVIFDDQIAYDYKYADRSCFKDLMKDIFEDDILIIKNGFVTDTSFSNIVLFDGTNWITPSTYLLNGTMRSFLLDSKKIIARDIRVDDIKNFESAKLINAMMSLEDGQIIPIEKISF
jgi:4-amino-4-deoxychorismate lyase